MLPSHVLKAVEMGLIPVEAIVRWADQQIIAQDKPESWLIDLATAGTDSHNLVSKLRSCGATTQVDDDTLLALTAFGLFNARLTLEQVQAALVERFCTTNWEIMTPLRQKLFIFDDEMDWNKRRARRTCEKILEPFRDTGEKLLAEYL